MNSESTIAVVYFFYGLAFFSMGLAITLEVGKCSDPRLRTSLRPLAVFGLLHGMHEWVEMFDLLGLLHPSDQGHLIGETVRLAMLVWSFLSLAAFGSYLTARNQRAQQLSLLFPLFLLIIWSFGLFIIREFFGYPEILDIADVWTRYTIAIPASLAACVGLVIQQREFRRAGMAQFGRDSLWAAVAFFWYGMAGQIFTRYSALPPSTVINSGLFFELFGFPIQFLRAGAAIVASFFVIRFLRAFEVETQRQIEELRTSQLQEAQQREALRGEILRRIVHAQEAERQRIARELHDETGQALTALGLGLRGVATLLRQDLDSAAHNLRQLEGLARQALDELQRLISDLRPSHLDDLGLSATLRWYTNTLKERTGLKISLEINGDRQELPSEIKTALFRIIQEALTNVVKHAAAEHVYIILSFGEHAVVAQVSDDGSGFDLLAVNQDGHSSYGLLGMRERAEMIDGSLSIESQVDEGTWVQITIPYTDELELVEDGHSNTVSG